MRSWVQSRQRHASRWPVEAAVPDRGWTSPVVLLHPVGPFSMDEDIPNPSEVPLNEKIGGINTIELLSECTRSDMPQMKEAAEQPLPLITVPAQGFPQLLQESDLECPLCCRLLYQPVTTICGHTYCKNCLVLAMNFNHNCPLCRKLLQDPSTKRVEYTVSFILATLIEKSFPKQYISRKEEVEEEEEEARRKEGELLVSRSAPETSGRFVGSIDGNTGTSRSWSPTSLLADCLASGCYFLDD